ncbi:cyanophycinase [Planctomycetales bacterium]|nr:cyanophycinase [Planctomycetales bacterium]
MKKSNTIVILLTLFLVFGTTVAVAEDSQPALRHGPEKGSLVIIGGGTIPDAIWDKIVELGGGKENARFVAVTNASLERGDQAHLKSVEPLRQRIGDANVTLFELKSIEEANDEKNLEVLKNATGIFFCGGQQIRIADAYLDTLAQKEFHNVLARGGVIAGTSAGATIQGSIMGLNRKGMVIPAGSNAEGELTRGFGFLRDSVIAQHLLTRNRQFNLVNFVKAFPQLLGIGLDESTAIVVIKDEFEVIGNSYVAIYGTGEAPFFFLKAGQKYDLKKHKTIKVQKNK